MKITDIDRSFLLIALMDFIKIDKIQFTVEDIKNSNLALSLLTSDENGNIIVELITKDEELALQYTNSVSSDGLPN